MGGRVSSEDQESLLLTGDCNSRRNYGSFFNYRFFRKGITSSSKTLNRSDSMVSLSHRALSGFITDDDLHGLQVFLENKRVIVDDRDENGATALHLASTKGKLNFVRELISHGADVNAEDNDNWSPLLCAAKEGHLEVCQELLDREANIEQRDMGGWTALMWASYKRHTNLVLMLLNHNADVNAHGNYHISSLLWAAGRGYTDIAKALIQHGAKVNIGDKYGTTALVWAARKGNAEIVDCLLKAGANVDTAGMYSWTPLLVATMGNHVDVVSLILECRPNVNAVDKDGCTALTIACKEGYTEIAQALLNAGAYINIQDRSGDTNLIHAVKGGHRSVVDALLKKYADVDIPGKERKTATYSAVDKGNIPILKMILCANPDLEIATKDGDTPLLRAVRCRNTEAVQLLLEKKARVSAADRWGDTALHIAMRARSKAVVEILLRNPKNSQLLYRPNRSGETPYNIDMNHPKTILGQIFGARRLNTNEDNENLLGYDLYSSALADMLSEPSLSMPITVGLYAKWGSGKSFLLNKLREEMLNFARQWFEPMVQFSWLLLALLGHIAVVLGLLAGLVSFSWVVGVFTTSILFISMYMFLLLLWYGSQRYSWKLVYNLSIALTQKMNSIRVVLQVIFCHPPGSQWSGSTTAQPIRFYFTDQTRVSSTALGENSVVQMIGSLYDAIESDYGIMSTRLYRAFRPKPLKSTSSWRWRKLCCLPDVVMFELCFICFLVLVAVYTVYMVELPLAVNEVSIDRMTAHILFGICGSVVVLAIVANIYTLGRIFSSLIFSQRKHLQRVIARMDTIKSEGFLPALKLEVNLMKDMVKCLDAYSQQQTRLVVIVDGLDSCEQDKVLLVLDTVHNLFSDANTPFIIILAIDPHIISKAVELNSRRHLSESNIGGHDYLRNMVHLPFFLQNSGLRKLRTAQASANKKNLSSQNIHDMMGETTVLQTGSVRRLSNNDAMLSRSQEKLKMGGKNQNRASTSGLKRLKLSDSIASSLGSNLNRAGGPHELSKMLLTDDYFSDVNPRSMRRLMNVVYITGRLLKAFQIDFNWYHLASWINITEQWPYRTSWIILYHDSSEDTFEDNTSLKTVYDKVRCHIPTSKEVEPLLEMDRDEKKLDIFLTFHRSNLFVGDLRIFLPFTINLDPYIKKVIKDEQQTFDETLRSGLGLIETPNSGNGWTPSDAWSLFKKSQFSKRQKTLKKSLLHQDSVASPVGLPLSFGGQAVTPMMPWQTPQHHPVFQGFNPVHSPPPLPNELNEIMLETLTVSGVCELIMSLTDLQQAQVSTYVNLIQTSNITGKVLMYCDLNELKEVMRMSFGDWEMFKMVLLRLREAEYYKFTKGSPPTSQYSKNVRFGSKGNKQQQQSQSQTSQTSMSEKERTVTKQSVMEKQVTLEEQMICGALQTLNEEACEDVMEENKDNQEQGDIVTFDHLGRVASQTSCYSNVGEETDMILLQFLPGQNQNVPRMVPSRSQSPTSLCDVPVISQNEIEETQMCEDSQLLLESQMQARPASLLMNFISGSTESRLAFPQRSYSVDDDRSQVMCGVERAMGRRVGRGDDESTPLVSDHSSSPSTPCLLDPSSSHESLSTQLEGPPPSSSLQHHLSRQSALDKLPWDDPETRV